MSPREPEPVLDSAHLPTPWLPLEHLASVDSTNAEVLRDPRPWRVVMADEQLAGRGRMGRTWVTSPGQALAVSCLVPATGMPLGWLPLLAGLAARSAVHDVSGVACDLKWPNDLLVPAHGDRKLAGILCEWNPAGVVIGLGMNLTQGAEELPLETATSLHLAGAKSADRGQVLTAYLKALSQFLTDLTADPEGVRAAYQRACATIGRTVRVIEPAGERHGEATGVDDQGRLLLTTPTGVHALAAGDVIHVRAQP